MSNAIGTDEYLIRNPNDENPSCIHCGGYLERKIAQRFNIGNSSVADSSESCGGLNRKLIEEIVNGIPHPRYQRPGDKIVINHSDGCTTVGKVLSKRGNSTICSGVTLPKED